MSKRKSRAGETQPSGLYVRKNRPDGRSSRANVELDAGAITTVTKASVTLATVNFLEPKEVAGEWL